MGLLAKGLSANLTLEGFLPRVGPEVDLDVGLVEKTAIADPTPVDGLLLVPAQLDCHGKGLFPLLHLLLQGGGKDRALETKMSPP